MITEETILEAKPYPQEIIKLSSLDGFISEFYLQSNRFKKSEDAFDFLNELHEKFFGKPRFADYHSFKNQRNARIKKLRS